MNKQSIDIYTSVSKNEETKLLYMSDMNTYIYSAVIVDIRKREDGNMEIYLNQTIFYPQGGGQPWDTGSIEVLSNKRSSTAKNNFNVIEVRYIDGRVMHVIEVPENIQIQQGSVDALISIGDRVICSVDKEKEYCILGYIVQDILLIWL